MAERQYLSVPFNERDAAKAAGARWDAKAKSWWASDRVGRARIERWLPENQQAQQTARISEEEARLQFTKAMRDLGLKVSGQHPIMDGKTHRVPVGDDTGARVSGRYVGYLDGHPAGHIKNYKTGIDTNWKSDGAIKPPGDMAAARAEDARRRQERDDARLAAFEATARRVSRQAERLAPLTAATPYMQAKGIEPSVGALSDRDGRTLYLPAIDVEGKQWTMQYIRDDGSKRFAKDSRKEGAFHVVGGDMAVVSAAAVLIVAEGYATAKTVSDAAKSPTIVAFDSGNLSPVVEALHARFPDKPILVVGDDDRRVEIEKGFNPGRDKATDAAASVGGAVILPAFAPGEQETDLRGFTDFNDMATRSRLGREGVELQVIAGIEAAILARELARSVTDTPTPAHTPEHMEGKTMADDTKAGASTEPAPIAPTPAPAPGPASARNADTDVSRETERPPIVEENTIAPSLTIPPPGRDAKQDGPEKAADASPPIEPGRAAAASPEAATQGDKPRERSTDVGDVPDEIAKRYFVQKSKWSGEPAYHETATSKEPAFRDQGAKLVAGGDSPAIARDLVAIAEHRGWHPVQVAGAESFKREIWLAASEKGLEVRGYKPNERDIQELTRRAEARSDRVGNSIAPINSDGTTREAAGRPQGAREAGNGTAKEQTFETGITGRLAGSGEAIYDEKKGGKPTPYVDIELAGGATKRAWGVGLPDALAASGKAVGDAVTVQRLGKETVQVQVPVVDPETKARTLETRDVERNRWLVQGADRSADRAQPSPVDRQATGTQAEPAGPKVAGASPQSVATPKPADPPAPREYLAVPYKDRDAAKEAGARWDAQAKSWYAGEGASPGALAKWQVRDQGDERAAKLIGGDRNARAQMRVIETVVAKSLADNPDAAARILKEARSELAKNVEQGREGKPALVRENRARAQEPARPATARPVIERTPPAPSHTPKRKPPEISRSR